MDLLVPRITFILLTLGFDFTFGGALTTVSNVEYGTFHITNRSRKAVPLSSLLDVSLIVNVCGSGP